MSCLILRSLCPCECVQMCVCVSLLVCFCILDLMLLPLGLKLFWLGSLSPVTYILTYPWKICSNIMKFWSSRWAPNISHKKMKRSKLFKLSYLNHHQICAYLTLKSIYFEFRVNKILIIIWIRLGYRSWSLILLGSSHFLYLGPSDF